MEKLKQTKAWVGRMKSLVDRGYVIDGQGRLVHRKICWKAHGPYPHSWVVHHIDEDKKNNKAENLIAMPRKLHDSMHKTMRRDKRRWPRVEIEQAVKAWTGAKRRNEPSVIIVINRQE